MTSRALALAATAAAVLAAANPAFAIQEVTLGARAPSFASGPMASLGWQDLPMPGSPLSFSGGAAARDPRQWAFSGGETVRIGSFLFNTTSVPNWAPGNAGAFGFASSLIGSRRFEHFGFTTQATAGFMASENLMFYTSVGQTSYRNAPPVVPVAPGLSLIEAPSGRSDVRAGFKMELMPGLTFGAEAGFSQPSR
jgi:hypothetical protein